MEGSAGEEVDRSPAGRRRELRSAMHKLADRGRHCGGCSGVCCTFIANSMKVTPLEAFDMYEWLHAEGLWEEPLFDRLRETVDRFRLAHETGDGRRSLRKTYTCPFYSPGPRGCGLSPDHKPYGCLAFNPLRSGVTEGEGGDCASDARLLESFFGEAETRENERLKRRFGLFFDTAPIPVALLALKASLESAVESQPVRPEAFRRIAE